MWLDQSGLRAGLELTAQCGPGQGGLSEPPLVLMWYRLGGFRDAGQPRSPHTGPCWALHWNPSVPLQMGKIARSPLHAHVQGLPLLMWTGPRCCSWGSPGRAAWTLRAPHHPGLAPVRGGCCVGFSFLSCPEVSSRGVLEAAVRRFCCRSWFRPDTGCPDSKRHCPRSSARCPLAGPSFLRAWPL